MTTAFPVMEAAGQLDPGVYVMAARPAGDGLAASDYDDDSSGTRATQWFIVSHLGLTAFTGKDGVHVSCARSQARDRSPESKCASWRATMRF